MQRVGSKIYYDVNTGIVLVYTSEYEGTYTPATIEQDIETFSDLSNRNRESFDLIQLEYGQYRQEFILSQGDFRVVPETKELEFSYPDPNEPEVPQPYQPPLSEVVNANTDYLLDVDYRLLMVELGI